MEWKIQSKYSYHKKNTKHTLTFVAFRSFLWSAAWNPLRKRLIWIDATELFTGERLRAYLTLVVRNFTILNQLSSVLSGRTVSTDVWMIIILSEILSLKLKFLYCFNSCLEKFSLLKPVFFPEDLYHSHFVSQYGHRSWYDTFSGKSIQQYFSGCSKPLHHITQKNPMLP